DLLRTTLRGGNFAASSFGGAGPSSLSQLEVAFQQNCGPGLDCRDVLAIDRLFYQVPFGDVTLCLGGRIGQDDMLAIWPSVYPAETVLDVLTLGGAPGAYNKILGTGAGLAWRWNGLAISANYVAGNGDDGAPGQGGFATAAAGSAGSVQLGYGRDRWRLAALYSRIQNGNDVIAYGTDFVLASYSQPGVTSAVGLGGSWQPSQPGWIPAISAGWGLNSTDYARGVEAVGLAATTQSWGVGLQWPDAFVRGNTLGLAVAQPPFATRLVGGGTPRDGNAVWEGWYRLQLTDQISVTPALLYLSRPLGANTPAGRSFQQVGGLVKTSFRF
ncbi:MAG: carbohydrate porin, partial [Synechococcaceae cyanobacterium]|nr:carbohydrate porin [Synechococcaceae cyanobacterium]